MKNSAFTIAKELNPIADVLNKRYGVTLGKRKMFRAFWRGERKASVSVDTNRNIWYDHGAGHGGTVIDLVMVAENVSKTKAVEILMSDHPQVCTTRAYTAPELTDEERNSTVVRSIDDKITNRTLLNFMASRGIRPDTLDTYCRQVNFYFMKCPEKVYSAVGFANDKEGYELRNTWFKGCVNKALSHICNGEGNDTVAVFEGFTDFLTFAQTTLYNFALPDIIVLNSISMSKNAVKRIREKGYTKVWLCLDNDKPGRRCHEEMADALNDLTVGDLMTWTRKQHPLLTKCNDFNELFCTWREDTMLCKEMEYNEKIKEFLAEAPVSGK